MQMLVAQQAQAIEMAGGCQLQFQDVMQHVVAGMSGTGKEEEPKKA